MSVEHPDIQYLKSDEVGRVIAQGLAELYRVKPEFPLDYLSKWLYNYSSQQEAMKKLKEEQKRTKLLVEDLQRDKVTREEKENILRLEEETKVRKVVSFEEYIENYEYPDELVGTFFPQGIYDLVENLTAAYVAFYEFRKKDFDALENDDETAHLDFNLPKVIQYVGGDNGTAAKAENWILPEGAGITYKLFTEPEVPPQADPADPNDEDEKEPQSKYIYEPDVVTNPNVHFFDLPRLGAYLSVPLIVKSYLNAESFDDAVAKFKLYKEQVEENNKQKEAKIAEFEDKITAAKDSGEEYEEIVREYQEMQTNWAEVAYPDYVNEVKKYALCVDTLGQDREVPSEDIKKVDLLCQAYVRIWEKTEHKYLMEDVERFIEYEKSVDLEEVIRAFNDAEEKQVTLKLMGAGDLTEEKADYKSDEIRLQVVKEQLLNKDLALKHLLNLNQYQILKFPRVLQNAFYLVGMTKAEVNKPDRNELNWRSVRNSLLTEAFIDRLFQYQYSGQKNDTIPAYAKVNRILKRVSEINIEEVNAYNIGLGRLLRYLQLVTALRIKNINIRKNDREDRRQLKIQRVAEAKAREDKLILDQQDYQSKLEQGVEYNDEEFMRIWLEDNPEIEIPPDVEEEFDLDFEDPTAS